MKMKKIFKINALLVLGALFLITSCTKDFEEMNINPNEPNVAPPTNVLTYAVRYFATNFYDDWMDMNNFESYAGHLGKIQYIDEARYEFRGSVVNAGWRDMYYVMHDAQDIADLAAAADPPNTNLQAVGLTWKAFVTQIATDTWKAIPYTEALHGLDGVINPAYDNQESIYGALFQLLEDAEALYAAGEGDLGEGDILYGGDVAKWRMFCNSLRMRMAMRISNVNAAKAKTEFEKAVASPVMGAVEDMAALTWPGVPPYEHPWYRNRYTDGRDDHGVATYIIDAMKDVSDPRIAIIAKPAESDGEYRGVVPGAEDGTFSLPEISRIGAFYRDRPAGETYFMRYSEVLFLKAEAALNGWNNGGMTAQEAYEAGITASMQENTITDDAAIADYLTHELVVWSDNTQENYEQIYLQKWFSLFSQGHEAWAECRRTDIPVMPAAPGSPYTGHNRPPFRYPYPSSEYNLNSGSIGAVDGGIVDSFWGQQMWWDTRTGVQ